ncbi:MAG: ribonuclease III domain-containing protein, partial [Vicinamibacteria bacterium]
MTLDDRTRSVIETALGYKFKDAALVEQALTHRSLLSERRATASNEPLEFLGDAVLGFVVAEMLHRRDPMGAEGDKTRIRARLVSTPTLVSIGGSFNVGSLILMTAGEEKNDGRSHDKVQEDAV